MFHKLLLQLTALEPALPRVLNSQQCCGLPVKNDGNMVSSAHVWQLIQSRQKETVSTTSN